MHLPPPVIDILAAGFSCLQSPRDMAYNLAATLRQVTPSWAPQDMPFFAAVEDDAILRAAELRPFNLSSLSSFAPLIREAQLRIPLTIANALIDQLRDCAVVPLRMPREPSHFEPDGLHLSEHTGYPVLLAQLAAHVPLLAPSAR